MGARYRIASLVFAGTLTAAATAQGSRIDRALQAARAAVRAGEPRVAIEVLQRADPTVGDRRVRELMAQAHYRQGLHHQDSGAHEPARLALCAADGYAPGRPPILYALGTVLFELERYREAEECLRRAVDRDPDNAAAWYLLGRLARGRDDLQAASDYFGQAARCAPERADVAQLADKLRRHAAVERQFVTLEKGHFRVQFERGQAVGVEPALASIHAFLEQAHRELSQALGGQPSGRITVVVYNQAQFRRVSSMHAWARAYFDGKVRVAVHDWPGGRADLCRDLRHELTHAFLRSLYPKAPTWLHEGLAQLLAGGSVAVARERLRSGGDRLLPLSRFLGRFADTADAQAAAVGYAQALVLVDHLQSVGGRRGLQALLREFRGSDDARRAVRLVYRKDIEVLLRDALR